MFGIKIISSKKFDEINQKIQRLQKEIGGELVCGGYCVQCKHGVETGETYIGFGESQKQKKYVCELSLPCMNFARK